MQRTVAIRFEPDDRLIDTIETVNRATNDILHVGFDKRIYNKLELHHLTYYPIREKYPKIPSSIVTAARDTASEMLKRVKFKTLPSKKKWSSIRYNQRTFKPYFKKGLISMSTVHGRIKVPIEIPRYFRKYLDWKVVAATLRFDGKNLVLGIIVEERTPSVRYPEEILGVDTGILNHAVLSNNRFHSSNHIRKVKGKYQYLRRKLQSVGTRSAKRKLKKISRRERRFMTDYNHQISKWIVSQPFDAVALEKLNVKKDKKLGKRFNRNLGNWAFGQLQEFILYKGESEGKAVVFVDARYTSQKCSRCNHILRKNRKGSVFKCTKCSFELHSDLNAARNIANLGRAEIDRLFVNQPNVTSSVGHIPSPQLQAHDFSRG